jgi:LacI family transcriptional regulator
MAGKGATLHDVAARAGVSIATVSRVVRNVGRVTPATRQRVQEAIAELRYQPNESGRALVNRRHDTLGLIIPGLVGPFFAEIVQGCTEIALEHHKSVLVFSTHHLPNTRDQIMALVGRVDGLAIMGGTIAADLLTRLEATGCPLVLVSQHPVNDIPTVRVDNITGTRALLQHLIQDHGYRRFAFAGDISGSPDASDRWSAVVATLTEAGLCPPDAPMPVPFNYAAGPDVAETVLALDDMPEAIVCGNDEIAIGAIGALRSRGIRVPEDVTVTGWDDIMNAIHTAPSLTTVQQFPRELGHHAARTLMSRIAGEHVLDDDVLPTRLVIRESCGCPPSYEAGSTTFTDTTRQPVMAGKEA